MARTRQRVEEFIQDKGEVETKPPGLAEQQVSKALLFSRTLEDNALSESLENVRDVYVASA